MQRTGYDRFALVSNPFHDLASESLAETEVFHVTQEHDEPFERMKQDVLDGTRKAFVLVCGPLGAGKTQRLKVTQAQAEQAGAFALYLNLGESPPAPVGALAGSILAAAKARRVDRGFAARRWVKVLKALAKGKAVAPETAGHRLAEALGALAPSYVLLNDLDALAAEARPHTLDTLLALVSNMPSGCMVTLSCQTSHVASLKAASPALASRLNRVLDLRGLADDEAQRVLAKRMAGKRLIEDIDPLYPFTTEAVAAINRVAAGSPRRLLQLADLVLDAAVKERAFQVGPELVHAALGASGSPPLEPDPATPAEPWNAPGMVPLRVRSVAGAIPTAEEPAQGGVPGATGFRAQNPESERWDIDAPVEPAVAAHHDRPAVTAPVPSVARFAHALVRPRPVKDPGAARPRP